MVLRGGGAVSRRRWGGGKMGRGREGGGVVLVGGAREEGDSG